MSLDPALAATLRRLHSEFIRGTTPRSRALAPAAEALSVLPITDDWERDLGIGVADGEVISFNREPPHDPRVEPVFRRRLSILSRARFDHPELAALLPPRPPDAADCKFCGGRGERTGRDSVVRSCPHCCAG